MNPLLSVIIAHRNEPEHLIDTVRSIRETAPAGEVEILVMDDASDPVHRPGITHAVAKFDCTFLESKERKGHAAIRTAGANCARAPWLLFTDAHMFFEPGWFEAFKRHAEICGAQTLLCGPYIACRDNKDNIENIFWGARFNFFGPCRSGRGAEILDYLPLRERPEFAPGEKNTAFEVPSVIGANYFMARDWFRRIGGLSGFIHWTGTDEWMLAVKTWLCGGRVMLMPNVCLRHILYPTGKRSIDGSEGYGKEMNRGQLLYNRLAAAYQVMPPEMFNGFLDCLPMDRASEPMETALTLLQERQEQLDGLRLRTQTAFVHSIDWLCDKFDLLHPVDIGAGLLV